MSFVVVVSMNVSDNNILSGGIPSEFGNMESLSVLSLSK